MGSLTVFQIPIIYTQKLHFNLAFWGTFRKLYISMRWLSIRENDFMDCWGKDFNCPLSLHRMSMLSQSTNFDSFYMDIQTHAELTRQFRHLLSWPYKETISSLAEPMGKQFHRLLSQRENGVNWMMVNPSRLWRRRFVCTGGDSSTEGDLSKEDGRQGADPWDRGQGTGDKEQRHRMGAKVQYRVRTIN